MGPKEGNGGKFVLVEKEENDDFSTHAWGSHGGKGEMCVRQWEREKTKSTHRLKTLPERGGVGGRNFVAHARTGKKKGTEKGVRRWDQNSSRGRLNKKKKKKTAVKGQKEVARSDRILRGGQPVKSTQKGGYPHQRDRSTQAGNSSLNPRAGKRGAGGRLKPDVRDDGRREREGAPPSFVGQKYTGENEKDGEGKYV